MLLHDDLLFNMPSGQTITKSDDLEVYRSGGMQVSFIEAGRTEVRLINETAVVSIEITLKGKYFEHVLDGRYKYLRVWRMFEHGLKVVAGSCAVLSE